MKEIRPFAYIREDVSCYNLRYKPVDPGIVESAFTYINLRTNRLYKSSKKSAYKLQIVQGSLLIYEKKLEVRR